MKSGLGHGKSWKFNQMVSAFLTRTHVSSLYMHYHCLPSDSVQHRSAMLSSNALKLQLLEMFSESCNGM